jgi:hypothetical protein
MNTYNGFGKYKPKILYTPYDASQYTTIVQKKCSDPVLWQKPIPGPKNGNTTCAVNLSVPYSKEITPTYTDKKCTISN